MQNSTTQQALAQDIKREVLAELQNRNRAYTVYAAPPSQSKAKIDQTLIQTVKQEILWELQQEANEEQPYPQQIHPYQRQGYPQQFQTSPRQGYPQQIQPLPRQGDPKQFQTPYSPQGNSYPDRALIDSVKQDVMAQIESEQEMQEQRQMSMPGQSPYQYPDPALVQAIKQEVLFELQTQAPRNS